MQDCSPLLRGSGAWWFWALLAILPLAGLLLPPTAHAQATKIFVASFGADTNDGSRGAPKRNFQAAHDAVAAGGEVVALDTAGYGTLTITKSVGVTAPAGITGFVTVTSGGNGITVSATSPDAVTLRGLTINAPTSGSGAGGIVANSVGTLEVNDCVINGFSNVGIDFGPSNAATLLVKNSTLRDNSSSGIRVPFGAPAAVKVVVENCRLEANGLDLANLAPLAHRADLHRTVITGASSAVSVGGPNSRVALSGCTLSANTAGINVQTSGATVRVDGCFITNNGTGLFKVAGANLLSRLNNTVENNTTDGTFSGSYNAK